MRIAMYASDKCLARLSAFYRRIDIKTVGGVAGLAVLALFWDSLLPALGHGLHLLVEVVELALEHLLEKLFGLTPRQAQTVLAWSALGLFLYGAAWALRKAYAAALAAFLVCKERVAAFMAGDAAWFKLALAAGAVGATLYLFS